jgi:hypothetical protein
MTFVYSIPTMLKLMGNDTIPGSEALEMAVQWVRLGDVPHAATLVAWLAALQAFSLLRMHGG